MNSNSYFDQIIYHFVLSDQVLAQNTQPEFFANNNLRELFKIAKEHVEKYKQAPTKDQVKQLVEIKGMSNLLTSEIIDTIYDAENLIKEYDSEWLDQNAKAWVQYRNLDIVIRRVLAYMKTTSVTAENAKDVVDNVRKMISTGTNISFDNEDGLDFFNPESHSQKRLERTPSGYNYIDLCQKGGNWKGAFIVYIAGPKSGKSFLLCNLAANAVKLGKNTAYITLELQGELVAMRIGANLLNIPLDRYEEFAKDPGAVKTKLNNLKSSSLTELGKLIIKEFPTSSASASDIEMYLLKEEERLGVKFDEVYIDYMSIMKNGRMPNSENTYLKLKTITEDLRAAAQRNNWFIASVCQVNRTGMDSTDIKMTDISESVGIIHGVDLLYALITSPEMKAAGYYYIKCLADRVAGMDNTRKKFLIDWRYGRLTEDSNSDIEDLESFINETNDFKYRNNKVANKQKHIPESQKEQKTNLLKEDVSSMIRITAEDLF